MSQADRILQLLRDGRWHSTAEILQTVPCVVHSRITDIRKRGHAIDHRTVGPGADGSHYRLVAIATLTELEQTVPPGTVVSSSASAASQTPSAPPLLPRAGTELAGEETDGSQTPCPTPSPAALSTDDVVALLARHGLIEIPAEPEALFEVAA